MQIKIINIPLTDDGTLQAELNRFLAGHKVLEVEQKFFQNEKGGCWSFCIRYIESAASVQASQFTGKEKMDYKQVSTIRRRRKKWITPSKRSATRGKNWLASSELRRSSMKMFIFANDLKKYILGIIKNKKCVLFRINSNSTKKKVFRTKSGDFSRNRELIWMKNGFGLTVELLRSSGRIVFTAPSFAYPGLSTY